jgi:hypothetical protein
MARKKKNTSEDSTEESGFAISKVKHGKPEKRITAVSFTKEESDHLDEVCSSNGTNRAEFLRQAAAFCLDSMGVPFPG